MQKQSLSYIIGQSMANVTIFDMTSWVVLCDKIIFQIQGETTKTVCVYFSGHYLRKRVEKWRYTI